VVLGFGMVAMVEVGQAVPLLRVQGVVVGIQVVPGVLVALMVGEVVVHIVVVQIAMVPQLQEPAMDRSQSPGNKFKKIKANNYT